jgi:hypothetical protein
LGGVFQSFIHPNVLRGVCHDGLGLKMDRVVSILIASICMIAS